MKRFRKLGGAFVLSVIVGSGIVMYSTPAQAGVPDKICEYYQALYDAAAGYPRVQAHFLAQATHVGCTLVQ